MTPELMLWVFACACFAWAAFQDGRACYWEEKYDELRNSPVVREVFRQLVTEEDLVEKSEKEKHP